MKVVATGAVTFRVATVLAQPSKTRTVGFVANWIPLPELVGPARHALAAAFVEGLVTAGWIEGSTLAMKWRSAEGVQERRRLLVEELVRAQVDVLVVSSNAQAMEAMNLTKRIPIVVPGLYSPVELGIVKSLARPGGNVTGLSADTGLGLVTKHLSLLKQAAPHVTRVASLVAQYSTPANSAGLAPEELQAATRLGVSLVPVVFDSPEGLERAIAAAVGQGANAILVGDFWQLNMPATRARIARLAERYRLPAMYVAWWGQQDGLMTYGPDLRHNYKRAAGYVDRILRGADPGELPIEQASRLSLVVNLGAARAIGLVIPPAVLAQADHVIP